MDARVARDDQTRGDGITIRRRTTVLLLTALAVGVGTCGIHFFDRWRGEPVAERRIAAPPGIVWKHVERRVRELDVVVEEFRPDERIILLGWITPSADGRLYLDCDAGIVGSASLRPRIRVRGGSDRSTIVIGTETRSTAAHGCASTGRLEASLLERIEPAILAAERDATAPEPTVAPDADS